MSNPTKDDASLMLQIVAMSNADKAFQKAMKWFVGVFDEKSYEEFKEKYPIGSQGYQSLMKLADYGELTGTFVNRGLLSEDLLFDLYGSMFWEKLEPIVQGLRKDLEMPRLYENFEVCAKRYPMWTEKHPPKI